MVSPIPSQSCALCRHFQGVRVDGFTLYGYCAKFPTEEPVKATATNASECTYFVSIHEDKLQTTKPSVWKGWYLKNLHTNEVRKVGSVCLNMVQLERIDGVWGPLYVDYRTVRKHWRLLIGD